jgi:UDP-N-acetylglucosamine 2-epimerase (non-hydrolysing)
MKAAPIISAVKSRNARIHAAEGIGGEPSSEPIHPILVHTGQHYDQSMSDAFFADLNLAKPDFHLGVGSGSHAFQTAEVMTRFEEVLLQETPEVLIVVGDVNSSLACALVAAKSSFDSSGTRPLIVHVEAGLRSFDRSMPEEVNRILTDHLADLLFVTEESALENLKHEGVPAEKVYFVGNTMIDSLLTCKANAGKSPILDDLGLRGGAAATGADRAALPYALLTLHRPANVDNRDAFLNILGGLEEVAAERAVIFPVHPRTQGRIAEFGLERFFDWGHVRGEDQSRKTNAAPGIHLVGPLGYLDFICLMTNASVVVTDSGGIQEETTCLGVPCVTIRENTERPITIKMGTNILAGVTSEGIRRTIRQQLASKPAGSAPELWDGRSAQRIVEIVSQEVQRRRPVSKERDTAAQEAGVLVSHIR